MLISLSYPLDLSLHILTQGFGENPEIYKQFIVKGLPLQGHNGLDYAPSPLSIPLLDGEASPEERGGSGVGSGSHEVFSASPGTILKIAYESHGFGHHIWIRHENFRTLYAHLSRVLVGPAQPVNVGDVIGYTGSTGYSSAVHLHFGLYPDGEPVLNGYGGAVDPTPFFGSGAEFTSSGVLLIVRQPSTSIPYKVSYLKPKPKKRRK